MVREPLVIRGFPAILEKRDVRDAAFVPESRPSREEAVITCKWRYALGEESVKQLAALLLAPEDDQVESIGSPESIPSSVAVKPRSSGGNP